MASGTIKAVVGRSDIVNNLTTNDSTKVLSAAQGKTLNDNLENFKKTYAGSASFDTITEPGIHYINGTNSKWGTLYVSAYGSDVNQTFIQNDGMLVQSRKYNSGTWSSWVELAITKDTQFFKHYLGNNLSITLPKYSSAICTCIVSGIGSSVFTVVRAGTTIDIVHLQGVQTATNSLTITAVNDTTATMATTARDVQFSMMLSNVI